MLEIVRARPGHVDILERFFQGMNGLEDRRFSAPHPFDRGNAERICNYGQKDLDFLLLMDAEAAAYGMLRGWNGGYAVPSLGIGVLPEHRRHGLGRLFMHFLHAAAWLRKSEKIRLRVHKENVAARNLYSSLGYAFVKEEDEHLVGFLNSERQG